MSSNIAVNVAVDAVPRGTGIQAATEFVAQSMTASFAWGSSPGTATIVYVAPNEAFEVATGALVALTIGAHYFCGICKSDVLNYGAQEGRTRTLQFADLREFLQWDWVFAAFNKPDVVLVEGVRVKRYKHIYPADYAAQAWTYTNSPLLGWQILDAILSFLAPSLAGGVAGGTIGSPWAWDLTGQGLFPGGLMNYPLFDLDYQNGKRLDAVLNDFCQRSGCVLGLISTPETPYQLVFTRKGYGVSPVFPANSDNQRSGEALSGNATNIRVLGDRNLYQVMDVPIQADWAAAWEQFLVFELFADDIYRRAGYNATSGDPEGYIGRQLATAAALSITVREYVDLRNSTTSDGAQFADGRKFAGRWRMDMPAALYIKTLLWRAFRPQDDLTFYNKAGVVVPWQSLDLADKLLCRVYQTDPTTGTMSFDATTPADGNGYAMARGYMVGADLFKSISSSQFNLNFFKDATAVWQHIPFQIDDSGEEVRFIIFDEPVIVSENMIVNVNGHNVISASFTLEVPSVSAALVFEAERYSYWQGTYPNVSRDTVENVTGLNQEWVLQSGAYTEIPYADGATADSKAGVIATAMLLCQYVYSEGGYKLIWQPRTPISEFGVQLSSMVDRVQITTSPRDGTYEVVDLTNERQRDYFEPERELDRRTQGNSLFPGQAELRIQAEFARKLASAFKQLPGIRRSLSDLVSGRIGDDQPLALTYIYSPSGTTPLGVGSVIRRAPVAVGTPNTNTVGIDPLSVTTAHTVLVGVTVRDGEVRSQPFRVQQTGRALVLVQGPVDVNTPVGLSKGDGSDTSNVYCLVANGSPSVGTVRQAISGSTVNLVEVDLGSGSGSAPTATVKELNFYRMFSDYMLCQDPANGNALVQVARPYKHRNSYTGDTEYGVAWSFTYPQNTHTGTAPAFTWNPLAFISRTKTRADTGYFEYQRIDPPYVPGDTIVAMQLPVPVQNVVSVGSAGGDALDAAGTAINWLDLNYEGHAWATTPDGNP